MKSMIIRGAIAGCMAMSAVGAMASKSSNNGNSNKCSNKSWNKNKGPKYVFLLVGDGMASVQSQAAEAYLTYLNGGSEDNASDLMESQNILNMNKLPIMGMATTYADTRFITDSAAAATAFACGVKTESGVIGRNTNKDTSYKSIAELAQEQGKAIGIISSVSLPHATPAAFYANVNSRNNYAEIGYQASQSGFDFFGGGWFRKLTSTDNAAGVEVGQALEDAGYTTYSDKEEVLALMNTRKVICSVETSPGSDAMPYAMDRPEENFSLAEVTQVAINCLQNDREGFFIFVEGGKIDWAGHANDAAANIIDTLAFDDAVGVAVNFFFQHPNDTLIVVTGDHETGGLTLGFAGNKYQTAFDKLSGQTMSYEAFDAILRDYESTANWTNESCNIADDLKTIISDNFGLVYDELADVQQEQLEAAYDRAFGGRDLADHSSSGYDLEGPSDVDYLLYGGYNAISMTLTHIMNQEAGLAWTSYSHTAVPVPVMAMGKGAERFTGFYDNTDIAKKLGQAMGTQALPVEDPDYAGTLDY
jgi:alkaline phosphatase